MGKPTRNGHFFVLFPTTDFSRRGTAARKPGRGFHRQSLGRQLRLVGEWTVEHMGKEDLQGALSGGELIGNGLEILIIDH